MFSSGKSLLYQLPAVLEPDTATVVISPLRSLIIEHGQSLEKLGVECCVFMGGDPLPLKPTSPCRISSLVLTTPEKFSASGPLHDLLRDCQNVRFVLDEGHCAVVDGAWREAVRAQCDKPLRTADALRE